MSPEPTQVVTGVISVEHQDTLPETALQEVDPAPPGPLPGLHLTCQNSPLPLRVRQQEGTVLALLVPCSYLELSMRTIGSCQLKLGGVHVYCLLDSGSEVSTITESFFNKHS